MQFEEMMYNKYVIMTQYNKIMITRLSTVISTNFLDNEQFTINECYYSACENICIISSVALEDPYHV